MNTEWTVDTLREHINELLAERDRRYDERARAAQVALDRAVVATDKRFEAVNEFRAQLSDQAVTFQTRREYDAAHTALIDKFDAHISFDAAAFRDIDVRISALSTALASLQGKLIAFTGFGALFGGAVAAVVTRSLGIH